jgi:hypothetical protein
MSKNRTCFCDALDRARRFGRHQGGSMAIFTALTDNPQVFSVGADVDYSASNIVRVSSTAQAIAETLSGSAASGAQARCA